MNKKALYLGVDPGRDKTGAALVAGDGTLVRQAILPTDHFTDHLRAFLAGESPAGCVLGDGTTSTTMHRQLEETFPRLPLLPWMNTAAPRKPKNSTGRCFRPGAGNGSCPRHFWMHRPQWMDWRPPYWYGDISVIKL